MAGARRISVGTEGNARSPDLMCSTLVPEPSSPPFNQPKGRLCPCRRRPMYT